MNLSGHLGCQEVIVDFHWRRPFQVGFHAPNQRDGAPNLNIGGHCDAIFLVMNEYVLSLCEICRKTFLVETSCDKSSARSSAVLPRDQAEVSFGARLEAWRCQIDITKNTRDLEGRVLNALKLSKELIVEGILRQIVDTVWVQLFHQLIFMLSCAILSLCELLQGLLHILGQIKVI
jgi:hypothetical protein